MLSNVISGGMAPLEILLLLMSVCVVLALTRADRKAFKFNFI